MRLIQTVIPRPFVHGFGLLFCALLAIPGRGEADIRASLLFDLQADFEQPSAVEVSDTGMVYVLDGVNGRVVKFTPEGELNGSLSMPEGESLNLPMDLTLYRNQIIVADSSNHRLVIFSTDGEVLTIIPLAKGDQKFDPVPTGLDVIDGVVYWSDRANSTLCSTALSTGAQLKCWGGFGTREGEFRYPFMISADQDDYLHVVDVLNGRVQIFNQRGRSFGSVSRFGVTEESLLRPNGISLEKNNQMLVSDAYSGRILLFRGRSFSGLLTNQSGKAMRFERPVGIARWQDRVYVVEMAAHRVRVMQVDSLEIGEEGSQDGAHFTQPTRQDCVTCHLTWSEDYQPEQGEGEPMPPVGSHQMCMSCHHGAVIDSRVMLGTGAQHPDYYHPEKREMFADIESRDDSMPEEFPYVEQHIPYCGTCHTPHRFSEEDTGFTQPGKNVWMRSDNLESEICRQCHESLFTETEDEARKKGIHPVSLDLDETIEIKGRKLNRLTCESCHAVHGGGEGSASLIVSDDEIATLCAACHTRHSAESLEEAREKGVHPLNIELDEPVKIGNQEVVKIDCLSCHSVHAGHKQTASLKLDHSNGEICEACHESAMAVLNGDHDLRMSAPDSQNVIQQSPQQAGVCGSCHSMHRNKEKTPMLSVGGSVSKDVKLSHIERDRLCQSCHHDPGIGKQRMVDDYTHPHQDLVMRSDPDSMPLLDETEQVVEIGEIACITCHDPHVWSIWESEMRKLKSHTGTDDTAQDGTILNSFLRQEHLKQSFCVECHGIETRLKYKYYHDQRGRPGRAEYLR
ncbi:MAG: NHL repeat-containing protein [Candidatus Thiodiazotropha taylori]|nr:NHL repeat-containing protein [Candidatus Thiodiazotropha taylori]